MLSNWWAHWSQERFSSWVMVTVLMTRSASWVEPLRCFQEFGEVALLGMDEAHVVLE